MQKIRMALLLLLICIALFNGCQVREKKYVIEENNYEQLIQNGTMDIPSEYPQRPINLVIPFGAGGGTDLWNRKLAGLMSNYLASEILVSNLTGGVSGAAGTAYVWNQPHEGYFISGTSETPLLIPIMTENSEQITEDWEYWIAGGSPGILCVNRHSNFYSLKQLINSAVSSPNEIKIASTNGGLWYLFANMLPFYGHIPFENSVYDGSSPAIKACIAGETEAVAASAGEAADYISTGELLPIAVFDREPYDFPNYGTIKSIADEVPAVRDYLDLRQFIGFMIPSDTPIEALDAIDEAFAFAMSTDEIRLFAEEQYSIVYNLTGEEARKMCADAQSKMSWMMEDMGMTKRSPDQIGILRP